MCRIVATLSGLSALALCLGGCALTPPSPAFQQIDSIAVMPFEGPRGDEVRRDLEALLLESQTWSDGNKFTVFTAYNPPTPQSEILFQSPRLTPAVFSAARGAGVQTLMTGTVDQVENRYRDYRVQRQCIVYDKDANCTYELVNSAYCTGTEYILTVQPQLIDVATGGVFYAPILKSSSRRDDEFCPMGSPIYRDPLQRIIKTIRRDVRNTDPPDSPPSPAIPQLAAAPAASAALPPSPAAGEGALALGRDDWRAIQRGLRQIGHDPGAIDGLPGGPDSNTRRALRAYQRSYGLAETGFLTVDQAAILARASGG